MSHHSRLLVQPSHSLGSVFLGALFITLLLASRGINQGVCPVPIFRVRSFAIPNLRGFLLDRINKTHSPLSGPLAREDVPRKKVTVGAE